MYRLMNFVSEDRSMEEYADSDELRKYYTSCGCDGLEVIRCGEDTRKIVKEDMVIGCHLMFYSDWVDFWNGNRERLLYKFGSMDVVKALYGTLSREEYAAALRADMDYAEKMGAKYAVFHVSDVSVDEGYTYRWEHTDKEVIDASCELLNTAMRGRDYSFELLLENLWWKGFSMTDPHMTDYMLEHIDYPKKGIMLDTGHLMNANLDIKTQSEGCDFIRRCIKEHGETAGLIRGLHLHQSVSGEYVKRAIKDPPAHESDYFGSFAKAYGHILKIDTHKPFASPAARALVEDIAPKYLVHELSAANSREKAELTREQNRLVGLM